MKVGSQLADAPAFEWLRRAPFDASGDLCVFLRLLVGWIWSRYRL